MSFGRGSIITVGKLDPLDNKWFLHIFDIFIVGLQSEETAGISSILFTILVDVAREDGRRG